MLGIDWPITYDTDATPAYDRIDDVTARETAHAAAKQMANWPGGIAIASANWNSDWTEAEIPIGYPDFNFICSTGKTDALNDLSQIKH